MAKDAGGLNDSGLTEARPVGKGFLRGLVQCHQGAMEFMQSLAADGVCHGLFHVGNGRIDDACRVVPTGRQVQERASPVVGGGMPGDIAQRNQGLHELTDGLFGDRHTGHEIAAAEARLCLGECADSPDPSSGKIAEPPCRERLGDGGRVAPHGAAEEPAEGLRIVRRRQTGA